MVMFIGQDSMSKTELALETARFMLSNLHDLHAFDPATPDVSRPIDTSEAVRRINDALREGVHALDKVAVLYLRCVVLPLSSSVH